PLFSSLLPYTTLFRSPAAGAMTGGARGPRSPGYWSDLPGRGRPVRMNRSIVTIEPALAGWVVSFQGRALRVLPGKLEAIGFASRDRKSTRLNSSHVKN